MAAMALGDNIYIFGGLAIWAYAFHFTKYKGDTPCKWSVSQTDASCLV